MFEIKLKTDTAIRVRYIIYFMAFRAASCTEGALHSIKLRLFKRYPAKLPCPILVKQHYRRSFIIKLAAS